MTAHANLCGELAAAHQELAQLESRILVDKRGAWENSPETSVSGRAAWVQYATADLEGEVLLLKGEIRAMEYQLRAIEWKGD